MSAYRKFALGSLFLLCATALAQSPTPPLRDPKLPVLKASAPIEIVGTVIAHDKNGGMGLGLIDVDAYLDVLVIRIEKQLKGSIPGKYVRADFLGGGSKYLPKSLFNGTQWIMKLEPVKPDHWHTCDWTISPEPPVGDLMGDFLIRPILVPVGGSKSIPDVNALQCYVVESQNLQEANSNPDR